MAKRLRSGFTTGSCAAAAAKAASLALMEGIHPQEIDIPFPDGSRKSFKVHSCRSSEGSATASVIKDAGDDPDVTNGAEIIASVNSGRKRQASGSCVLLGNIRLCRGPGVGQVTKPGLAIAVGEPAINPIPRQMICQAVREVAGNEKLTVIISVVGGEELALKTLNSRLGIVGGLSILGTTGIVRPISADAWTATIKASLDVAKEAGLLEVVLSTGRTSEKGAQKLLDLPEEAYAMMGDYLEFSLKEAAQRAFTTVHLAGMWAKIMKAALHIPQTHVRHGALEVADGARLLASLGADGELLAKFENANTAREMYSHIEAAGRHDLTEAVCRKARDYCQEVTGGNVHVYLVNHRAEIITHA
ncbi:MAG: cobalt-precorrin-5B (C(1))-methyltransferase CbiD [Proteobacteria bacterium]|nr:cobalt-precorrin-5B (C(1))-methyltransferase CbiD [Pseudomonadota bacterium]